MAKRKKRGPYARKPTKKKEFYWATMKIRCHIAVATEIRVRLKPGSARSKLFKGTCFGPWLDVKSTSNDSSLVHLILQTEYTPTPVVHQDALFFRVGGRELRFGPQEFCLITGMRFGPHHLERGKAAMTFRERVFGHLKAKPKVADLKNVFDCNLDRLSDLDAVRICLLMLVEVGFMGLDPRVLVDSALLELVEDLDSWNTFSWGSYVWKVVYKQLHNALPKRSARRHYIPLGFTLKGFIWAFKIWIFEIFPYAKRFATKRGGIPRAISWSANKLITRKGGLPFVMDATLPGFEPLPVLTPTRAESATDWWRASCQFFDGYANYSPPLLKKARLISPSQPLIMAYDRLTEDSEDSADTTTMPEEDSEDSAETTTMPVEDRADSTSMSEEDSAETTTMAEEDSGDTATMPNSDNSTGPQSTGSVTDTEKTMLEDKELWKARRPHCVKTEMPNTSTLFGTSDHVEDHVAGKVSSQSDIICVQGYKVKQSVALILESIIKKYGDIAADCIYEPAFMRSSFLEIICDVVSRIQTNDDIDKMEGIEQQLLVAEAANINVSWLRAHLDAIRIRKEASRNCSLLMEMKTNMGLVKKAALMDLRESCVELMAAQERFENAERCVRVLHFVEKNLNDSILESKVNIDSGGKTTTFVG